MTIYEITDEFMKLQAKLEEMSLDEFEQWKDGDDCEDVYQAYMNSAMAFEEKIDNTVGFIKDLQGEADAIEKEIANLRNRATMTKNKIMMLSDCLEYAFENMGLDKWSNARHRVYYRPSQRVEIGDEDDFIHNPNNAKYLKPQSPKIDRIALRNDLKQGKEVEGAALRNYSNFQIK